MKTAQRTREWIAEYLRAAVVGLLGALACILFRGAAEGVQRATGFGHNVIEGARKMPWWAILTVPAAGMAVAWAIGRFLVPAGRGAGFSDIMEAVSVKKGGVSLRSAVTRSLASLAAIGTGNSIGREGPIISLAAAASSRMTKILGATPRERGLLLGCGVAAGFAGAYNAPIAGAVFALEVVLGNFAVELFAPVVVASAISTLVTRGVYGTDDPIFNIPRFYMHSAWEVVPYIVLGVLCGFAAVGFQAALRRSEAFFKRLPLPRAAVMIVGGLLLGAIALLWPEVCGNGYAAIDEIVNQKGPRLLSGSWWQLAAMLVSLMIVKTIGTAITVGAGGAGGVFTPSMFIGAALGGAFGVVVMNAAPHVTGDWGGYALVGMGCLVAGTTRAPIMAVLVLFEMTLDYQIMVPLLLGGTTASLVARTIYPHSIYDEGLSARGSGPLGLEETVLTTTPVGDVMRQDVAPVQRTTPYTEIIPMLAQTRSGTIFVVGDRGEHLGVIKIRDVVELAQLGDLGPGIIAVDLMTRIDAVRADDPLSRAFDIYESNDVDEIPVVDRDGKLSGGVARKDVMAVLHMEVLKRQNLRAKFVRRDDEEAHADYVELPKGVELARVPARPEHAGRTFVEAQIRTRWRLTVLSLLRNEGEGRERRILPDADTRIEAGDDLIVLGTTEAIANWRGGDGPGGAS
ncbi:MAG: Voltage-gated ClC-type chloride channel ClcB [Planctomycetes bacterium]|nr:Voltage-gated ClC-type chloride channel ClcB [Planctomycetota bacterium]